MPEITTDEAHKRTGYSEAHLRWLAREERVKARKQGGKWLFDWNVLRLYRDGEWIGIRQASELTGYSNTDLLSLAVQRPSLARRVSGFLLFHRQRLLDHCRAPGRP